MSRLNGRHLLTIAEFCALTGVKPDTARDRCQRGALRCKKVKSRWRIYAGEADKQRGR